MEHSEAIHGRLGVSDPAKSTHDSFDSRMVHFTTRSPFVFISQGASSGTFEFAHTHHVEEPVFPVFQNRKPDSGVLTPGRW